MIEGAKARATIAIPAGVEVAIEELPLQDPRRASQETVYHGASNRRQDTIRPGEGSLFGWAHAPTQPRFTFRQAGTSGTLRVEVTLALK